MIDLKTAEHLHACGVKPSYTRMRIYEYLHNHHDHPTVEHIYGALKDSLPTLSKTTVYNTLKLFLEKHLVRELIMQNQAHYDIVTDFHAHFQCNNCHTIYDIPMQREHVVNGNVEAHHIEDVQLTYRGICRSCQQTTQVE